MRQLTGLRNWNEELGDQRVAQLAALKPGDLIQISRNSESFWVEIEGVHDDEVHAAVLNELMCDGNEGIQRGEIVAFRKCNVGQIDPGGDWNFQQGLTNGVYELYEETLEHYPDRSRECFIASLHKAADEAVQLYDAVQKLNVAHRQRRPS